MKINKNITNLDNIENKKIRKTIKRVIRKFSLDDIMQCGAILSGLSIAYKLKEKFEEIGL